MKKIAAVLLCLLGCVQRGSSPVPQENDVEAGITVPSTPSINADRDAGSDVDLVFDGSSNEAGPQNGETDIGCGGPYLPKCTEGKSCLLDRDCTVACGYNHVCVSAPSCKVHLGGDTCGPGEVGETKANHESCCKSLFVPGFEDAYHPGMKVYLDKYEITAGRVRAFIADVTLRYGKADIKNWAVSNAPIIWNNNWTLFMPSANIGGSIVINRLLLGDPRHDGEANPGPGVIVPPSTDQVVDLGVYSQFGPQVYADLHGNNCGTFAGSYGFPTYYFPPSILALSGQVARTNALTADGKVIPPQEFLDVKSMNCITNAMLMAFCAWDGGQLATAEVFDFVTDSPPRDNSISGCGDQYDNHGDLLGNYFGRTVQTGGRCAPVGLINATFDAGDVLPVESVTLNKHNYHYPDLANSTSDKSWQIAAPGRITADTVRIGPNDEPWMDLAGNLSEAVYDKGNFGLKGRGIGYGSARSDLNATLMPGETIVRLQRPEAKSALSGGRCMRFK